MYGRPPPFRHGRPYCPRVMSRLSRTSPLLRRARRSAGLAVLGGLALLTIAWSNDVSVVIDGEEHELTTYAATVEDALEELDVQVDSADEVVPAPQAELEDGLEIDVLRAITVDVRVDGRTTRRITAPVGSVAGVLEEASLAEARERGALIHPSWSAPVEDGDVVDVRLPSAVELTVDGETEDVDTHASTVDALLAEQGVEVADTDVVTPEPSTAVDDAAQVVVERVEHDEVVEEIVLEHEEVREETDDLDEGDTQVEQEGRDGLREDTYRIEIVDGEETDRELIDREVVTEPRDRVVLVGTRTPPPPEPETPSTPSGSVWDRLAECEANGNWQNVSANGLYYGGLQFHLDTWRRHKPSGYPANPVDASREQQIAVGERVQASQGWEAWPHCSRVVGLR
jgi:resuscitation-promoting factor RpfB